MDICIIGNGNVGSHLVKAFKRKGSVITINPRTLENLPSSADIYIIAVKDSAIEETALRLKGVTGIITHTSGTTPLSVLASSGSPHGVLYPLQTFSKDVPMDYSQIPMFIEGSDPLTTEKIREAAHLFSDKVYIADSKGREQIHIAAVFCCNFVNYLLGLSSDLLNDSGIPFSVLQPLVNSTIKKAFSLPHPSEGQTGPAARNDTITMNRHMESLKQKPLVKSIYETISQGISESIK